MNIRLLTEHHLEFLSLTGAAQARLSLHILKCHIVGNHMWRLICFCIHHAAVLDFAKTNYVKEMRLSA